MVAAEVYTLQELQLVTSKIEQKMKRYSELGKLAIHSKLLYILIL